MAEYTATFSFGREGMQNPSDITAKAGNAIKLPEAGQKADGKIVTKWFCNGVDIRRC